MGHAFIIITLNQCHLPYTLMIIQSILTNFYSVKIYSFYGTGLIPHFLVAVNQEKDNASNPFDRIGSTLVQPILLKGLPVLSFSWLTAPGKCKIRPLLL